ncbi:hypothetical protein FF38_07675 [Lucilia cuprina]|uniref:Uncharacterized protein n=1 Tax=Lucilia cuprina TaxID=7375 RepID=A0A0L0BNH9_LUCCU|nr:hypothetical protein FF38_07675 [Lucilia cuprina]
MLYVNRSVSFYDSSLICASSIFVPKSSDNYVEDVLKPRHSPVGNWKPLLPLICMYAHSLPIIYEWSGSYMKQISSSGIELRQLKKEKNLSNQNTFKKDWVANIIHHYLDLHCRLNDNFSNELGWYISYWLQESRETLLSYHLDIDLPSYAVLLDFVDQRQ